MAVIECLCNVNPTKLFKAPCIICNCGWELKAGYGVAVSLAILEAKRFFLLAFEMFMEWHIIYFAGGFFPVVFTLIATSVGFPAALAAMFTIHKRQMQPCYPKVKQLLRYLLVIIITCALLNVGAIASIRFYVSIRPEAVVRVFNSSMYEYVTKPWFKYTVDELQFTFQCCGHTSFTDWFQFDWQRVDYAARDEMARQDRISDEVLRQDAVPFSCCKVDVMIPCLHTQMSEGDNLSVNNEGCAVPLSLTLVRLTVVGCGMTVMLVLTQILLAILVSRIIKRPLPLQCPPTCPCSEVSPGHGSSCPLLATTRNSSGGYSSGDECNSTTTKKTTGKMSTIQSKCSRSNRHSSRKNSNCSLSPSPYSHHSSGHHTSARTRPSAKCDPARIRPSTHIEHRVPKKCIYLKRMRVN